VQELDTLVEHGNSKTVLDIDPSRQEDVVDFVASRAQIKVGFKTVANVAATAMTHLTAMANVTAHGKVLFQHGVVE